MTGKTLSQQLQRYTVIIVCVQKALLEWVKDQGNRKDYFPEEDGVWIVPNPIVASETPESFLDEHAKALLGAELERFGVSERVSELMQSYSIDDLIRIRIRDHIAEGAEIGLSQRS